MPWVSRATAIWPDNRYVANEKGNVNIVAIQLARKWHKADIDSVVKDVRFGGIEQTLTGDSEICPLMTQSRHRLPSHRLRPCMTIITSLGLRNSALTPGSGDRVGDRGMGERSSALTKVRVIATLMVHL